jgi:hypothetical protein
VSGKVLAKVKTLFAIEPEPGCLLFSAYAFLLRVIYGRLVNATMALSGLRANIIGIAVKIMNARPSDYRKYLPKLSDSMGYLIVAASFTVKNSWSMWSRRPRLLLKNSRPRLVHIFSSSGVVQKGHKSLAGACREFIGCCHLAPPKGCGYKSLNLNNKEINKFREL